MTWTNDDWKKFASGVHEYIRDAIGPLAKEVRQLRRDNKALEARIERMEEDK